MLEEMYDDEDYDGEDDDFDDDGEFDDDFDDSEYLDDEYYGGDEDYEGYDDGYGDGYNADYAEESYDEGYDTDNFDDDEFEDDGFDDEYYDSIMGRGEFWDALGDLGFSYSGDDYYGEPYVHHSPFAHVTTKREDYTSHNQYVEGMYGRRMEYEDDIVSGYVGDMDYEGYEDSEGGVFDYFDEDEDYYRDEYTMLDFEGKTHVENILPGMAKRVTVDEVLYDINEPANFNKSVGGRLDV